MRRCTQRLCRSEAHPALSAYRLPLPWCCRTGIASNPTSIEHGGFFPIGSTADIDDLKVRRPASTAQRFLASQQALSPLVAGEIPGG